MVVISKLAANGRAKSGKNNSSVCFVSGSGEFSGVNKIASKVRKDVERVTGALPNQVEWSESGSEKLVSDAENFVIYGTVGKNAIFSALVE